MFPVGCLFCHQDNPVGSRFCNECGKALRHKPCSHCGAVAERGASRCGNCGQAFAQQPALEVETVAWSELESDLAELESGLAAQRFGGGSIERPSPASAAHPGRPVAAPLSGAPPSVEPSIRSDLRACSEPRLSAGVRWSVEPLEPVERSALADSALPVAAAAIESGSSAGSRVSLGQPTSPSRRPNRLRRGGLVVALIAAVGLSIHLVRDGLPGSSRASATTATVPAASSISDGTATPATADPPAAPAGSIPTAESVAPAESAMAAEPAESAEPAASVRPVPAASDASPAQAASTSSPPLVSATGKVPAGSVGSPALRQLTRSAPALREPDAARLPSPRARECTEAVATLGLCQPSPIAEANR